MPALTDIPRRICGRATRLSRMYVPYLKDGVDRHSSIHQVSMDSSLVPTRNIPRSTLLTSNQVTGHNRGVHLRCTLLLDNTLGQAISAKSTQGKAIFLPSRAATFRDTDEGVAAASLTSDC